MTFSAGQRLDAKEVAAELAADGVLTPQQIAILERVAGGRSQSNHALELIATQNWSHAKYGGITVNLEWLSRWLSPRVKLEMVDLTRIEAPPEAIVARGSGAYANQYAMCPFAQHGDTVHIAVSEPMLTDLWLADYQRAIGSKIRLFLANPKALRDLIRKLYGLGREAGGSDLESAATTSMNGQRVLEIRSSVVQDASNAVDLLDSIL